ncbi:MAG: hypothetical protein ACXAD7_00665 [Candidatus Kariarchaeaceae archaeon]
MPGYNTMIILHIQLHVWQFLLDVAILLRVTRTSFFTETCFLPTPPSTDFFGDRVSMSFTTGGSL